MLKGEELQQLQTAAREDMHKIINDRRTLVDEKLRQAVGYVLSTERKVGSFFTYADDDNCYHFDAPTQTLRKLLSTTRIHPNFGALLYQRYGLPYTKAFTRDVVAGLEAAARSKPGAKIKRFSSFDQDNGVLYLSRYNGTCYKLDGKTISIVPNGSDGVLFADDDGGVPCDADLAVTDPVVVRNALVADLEYTTKTAGGLTKESQQLLFECWLYMVGFDVRTKPILILVGDKGSGKTFSIERLQQVVIGRARPVAIARKSTDTDLFVTLLHHPLALFDNVDSYIDWLPDAIASYATGGESSKRTLFTNSDQSTIKPKAYMAVTTRNPVSFYRDDVADRLVILRLKRRSEFGDDDRLLSGVEADRHRVFGAWLQTANRILSAYHAERETTFTSKYRLAGFTRFVAVAGKVLGYTENQITDALKQLQEERNEFTVENEPFLEILLQYLKEFPTRDNRALTPNAWFEILNGYAAIHGLTWSFKTPATLAMHIHNKLDGLKRRVTVEIYEENGKPSYAFSI